MKVNIARFSKNQDASGQDDEPRPPAVGSENKGGS
jgi:hypothetical protein